MTRLAICVWMNDFPQWPGSLTWSLLLIGDAAAWRAPCWMPRMNGVRREITAECFWRCKPRTSRPFVLPRSSSVLAPVPFYAAYRASKAAVSAFSETLRTELAPQGIRVVEIMPGPVDSDMLRHSQETMVAPAGEPYRAVADHMNASKSMVESMIQPAGDAARLIVDAILDDDGPMRYGCDPMSTGMIDAWRRASDE